MEGMRRRTFLQSAVALSGLALGPGAYAQVAAQTRPSARPRISEVEVLRIRGRKEGLGGVNRQHQVQPLHIYPEHRPKVYQDGSPQKVSERVERLYLRIRTDAGVEGLYGPVDAEAAQVVLAQLRSFLLGKDALAVEALWDKMYRLNRHSRAGHYMMAVSAVDNALWDLRGKYFNCPVYQLLGGPTRSEVEAYGSCLGYSVESGKAGEKARQLKAEGYRHQKWFLAYGPGDGPGGMRKNVELVAELRGAVGDEVEIALDAFNGWDLPYAIAWAKAVEKHRPFWIEEAFISDQVENFAQLSRATSIPVASGEHFYGRWEVQRFLQAEALLVVQADPEWCGGVSELVKICALASVHGVKVIPHGHNLHAALHVVASQSPVVCPLVEYLLLHKPSKLYFEKDPPTPKKGMIALPERAGFGIEFDSAKVEEMVAVTQL
jgi:L-alanine-DL-glutamate epimerase-like enolase superfamily enzyme